MTLAVLLIRGKRCFQLIMLAGFTTTQSASKQLLFLISFSKCLLYLYLLHNSFSTSWKVIRFCLPKLSGKSVFNTISLRFDICNHKYLCKFK